MGSKVNQAHKPPINMKFLWIFAVFFAVASAQKLKNCVPAARLEVEAKWPAKTDFTEQLNKIRDQVAKSNEEKYSKYTAAQILKFDDKLVEKWAKIKNIAKANVIKK